MLLTLVDGVAADTVPADDRGLNYSDGTFETLPCHEGGIQHEDLHRSRLTRALRALGVTSAAEQGERLFTNAAQCLETARHTGIARLTVTRGSGPRGYTPPGLPQLRSILSAYPRPESSHSASRCAVANTRWAVQPQLAGLKLLARTEQVLAAAEAEAAGWDDMVMLDSCDHVISSSRENLFMLLGEKVMTPCLDRCGIAGTRRELLLTQILPALNYAFDIRPNSQAECLSADAMITTNSISGVTPITQLGESKLGSGAGSDWVTALQQAMAEAST
jgi:4-amino-4-deoxychorismate lyase